MADGIPDDLQQVLQIMLDKLSTTPGAIIYRGPNGWRALEPGEVGQVLAIGPDFLPFWADLV